MGEMDIANLVSHLIIYMVVLLLAILPTKRATRGCRTSSAITRPICSAA